METSNLNGNKRINLNCVSISTKIQAQLSSQLKEEKKALFLLMPSFTLKVEWLK
jgi:hypothetical protein